MAHFAELDENNKVIRIIAVNNQELLDDSGEESEEKGIAFCKSLYGEETKWVQTSYNASFRYNYAGFGYTYDPVNDAFIPPTIFESWVLDETFNWQSPVPMPEDGKMYFWDEDFLSWKEAVHTPEN